MSRSKNKIGTCKLCLKENVTLRDSHILPKWGYKMVKDGSKDFIHITSQKSHYTNREHKEYLLCHECEQRFGKGEDYIRNLLDRYYNKKKLFNIVTLEPNHLTNPDANFRYPTSSINEEKIAYFATSIIWRAVVCSKKPENLHLGEYQEKVRQYLDEKISFLSDANLIVYLHNRDCGSSNQMLSVPTTAESKDGYCCHYFFFCGICFMLFLGHSIPPVIKKYSLINGDSPSIIKSLDNTTYMDQIRELVENSKATGRLVEEDDNNFY